MGGIGQDVMSKWPFLYGATTLKLPQDALASIPQLITGQLSVSVQDANGTTLDATGAGGAGAELHRGRGGRRAAAATGAGRARLRRMAGAGAAAAGAGSDCWALANCGGPAVG
jgi:hypothetical protein